MPRWMPDVIVAGGVTMYPLLLVAATVGTLIVQGVRRLAVDGPQPTVRMGIDAILFWGVFGVVIGVIGALVGIIRAVQAIERAGGVDGALAWGGIRVALITTVFSLCVFGGAALGWFVLRILFRRSASGSGGPGLRPPSKPTPLGLAAIVLPVLVAVGCAGDATHRSASTVVSDSAGVRIVANPAPDRPLGRPPVKIADLMTPDSALTPVPWGVAADPATGRIFVLDRRGARVVAFDRAGEYAGTVGRRGGGPGEFQNPAALSVGPDGALVVWDAGRGVLSRWSGAGDLLDERRAPVPLWGPGFHQDRGRIVTVVVRSSAREQQQALIELAGGDTAVLHTVSRELVPLELPCGSRPGHRLFAPDVVWAGGPGTVYVLNGPEYRIDVHTGEGLDSSIRRAVEPIPVTESMAVRRARMGPYAGFLRMCGVTPEQLVAEAGHVERTSAVRWIAVDPDGRLWVTRSSNATVPETVDRLDAEGRYEGTFDLPAMPVAFVSPSRFVSLAVRPETGQAGLSLYELRAAEDAAG